MNTTTRSRLAPKAALALALAAGLSMAGAAPAVAAPIDITRDGARSGGSAYGFLPEVGTIVTFDPSVDYPSYAAAPAGWEEFERTANLMRYVTAEGDTLRLYCIEMRHDAQDNYTSASWAAADIPNLGYVTQLLASSYPNTDEPASLSGVDAKITVVQAAIWYFTDHLVLDQGHPFRAATEALVNATLTAGPLAEPTIDPAFAPDFTLTGPTADYTVGDIIGPFTATSTTSTEPFIIYGQAASSLFADAAGTSPIAAGTELAMGSQFWVQATGTSLSLEAESVATGFRGLAFTSGEASMSGKAQTLITALATNSATSSSLALVSLPTLADPPETTPSALPDTGVDATWIAVGAGVLLALGAGLVLLTRRRNASQR